MSRIQSRWLYPEPVPKNIRTNLDTFTLPFRSILYRRGCKTMDEALSYLLPRKPSYAQDLNLRHVGLASKHIMEAVKKNQIIAIYGDYDADGITSTALLTLALQKIPAQTISFIPNRVTDGYGLKKTAINHLHKQGAQLLITVDNGIRSVSETAYAKSLGMDVIITDHHQPAGPLPDAIAIVNPKLPDDPYPNKNLAGVGVAFKLICSLAEFFPEIIPEEYLDLVALGTVADVVPLLGENRYLVKQGINLINQHPRQSIFSLIGASGLIGNQITASDISYQIAPRINSSGRLADAKEHLLPLELLLSSEKGLCGELAQIIDDHNTSRKKISREMVARIESEFAMKASLPHILISFEKAHHPGVCGIASGSLTNKYYLPSIVGSISQETTTASCRSIPEFDIISALSKNRDLFTHFGGHKLAAGFTLENENIPEFRNRMLAYAEEKLTDLDLSPSLEIDAVVSLSDLNQTLYNELLKLEPTGEGNPAPLFAIHALKAENVQTVGKESEHLKFIVTDGEIKMPAIGFGMGDRKSSLPANFSLACYLTVNEYRGNKEYQLVVEDLLASS